MLSPFLVFLEPEVTILGQMGRVVEKPEPRKLMMELFAGKPLEH